MSIRKIARVLHHSKAKGTAKVVLIAIANHDGKGGAWPSIATLAGYANVDKSNVKRALGQLVALGELEVREQWKESGTKRIQQANLYVIKLVCPVGCDGTPQHKVTPLPKAPADLWIDGGAFTHPGGEDAPRGQGEDAPRGQGEDAPRTVQLNRPGERSFIHVPQPQNAREELALNGWQTEDDDPASLPAHKETA